MSSTATIHKDEPPSRDRRCGLREPVQQAVLVFFGENNWGKLIDVGEGGMSFEFDQAPPLRQKINFKLEAMGCTAADLGQQHFNGSFGLSGEVVWTRQFERTAGVRFLDLPESSRQQIRNLIPFETCADGATADEPTRDDAAISGVLVPASEPSEPAESAASPTEAPSESEGENENTLAKIEAEAAAAELWTPPVENFDTEQIRQILEAPNLEAYKNLQVDKQPDSKSHAVGIALIIVFTSLAILAALAMSTRMPILWVRPSQAAEQISSTSADPGRPADPENRPTGLTPQRFVVEVSDANNKKWLLWFDRNLPKSLPMPVALKSVAPSTPAEPKRKSTGREQSSLPEKHNGLQRSKYFKPQLSHPNTNSLASHVSADAPPAIPDIPAAPLLGSAAGIPAPAGVLATPVVRTAPAGGKVQQARLLKSVPPVYPELARSLHLAGDVTLDALITADGNVRDIKVMSGTVLLQQAAINAVRRWKYEPAQLDGKPVPMHLSITVKFSSQ